MEVMPPTVHIYVVKMAHVMLHIHTQNIKCYIFVSYPNNKKKEKSMRRKEDRINPETAAGGCDLSVRNPPSA